MSATRFPAGHDALFSGSAVRCGQSSAAIGSERARRRTLKSRAPASRQSRASRRGCELTSMNDAEHASLVELEKRGKIVVGVDRPTARSFFTRTSVSKVENATGYAPYLEKWTVFFFFLMGPLALIGSIIAAILAFSWWALAVGAVCLVVYLGYQAMSSRGGAGAYLISILLVVSAAIHFLHFISLPTVTLFWLLYVTALWSTRMLYVSSTVLYRVMALRDAKLYNLLSEGIVLRQLE